MSEPRRRVALYGGCFDPPHLGHVLAGTWALCRGDVAELWLIPTYQHAFDKDLSPFESRCRMAEAAFQHMGSAVRIERIEEELGGTSYTIETIRALRERHPDTEFVWVCGADAWAGRERWKDWSALEAMLDWLVIGRSGVDFCAEDSETPTLPDISSTELRATLRRGEPADGWISPEVLKIATNEDLYL